MTTARRPARLVLFACALTATGVGVLVAVIVVRLVFGPDVSSWSAVALLVAVAMLVTAVAGVLSEPLVSRWMSAASDRATRK